jgi:hypothetical protein
MKSLKNERFMHGKLKYSLFINKTVTILFLTGNPDHIN